VTDEPAETDTDNGTSTTEADTTEAAQAAEVDEAPAKRTFADSRADKLPVKMLSDRILVIFNGQSMGVLNSGDADTQTLGLMMAGTPLADLTAQEAAS